MSVLIGEMFVKPLQPWEREELASVYAFIWGRLYITFSDVEDLIAADIKSTLHEKDQDKASTLVRILEPIDVLELHGLEIFQDWYKSSRLPKIIDFMGALGLPFLRHLGKLDMRQKMWVLNGYSEADSLFYFPKIFEQRPAPESSADKTADTSTQTDALLQPSSGWLWAINSKRPTASGDDDDQGSVQGGYGSFKPGKERTNHVQRLGIMFWDKSRLESLGIFGKALADVEDAANAQAPCERPSIEEKFKEVNFKRKALKSLAPPAFAYNDEAKIFDTVEY